jgi:excinuclease UvrABC nuclease subunit
MSAEHFAIGGDPASVYIAWSASGECLYVGCTFDVFFRLYTHETGTPSPWVAEAAHVDFTEFDWRADALDAEALAIWLLQPRYNVRGKAKPMRRLARAAA